MPDAVLTETRDQVLLITLNRPEARNAVNADVAQGIEAAIDQLEEDDSLWILFRDATSGVTTDHANRQLLTDPPAGDGTVHVDFNRAINMPCAYTDFATCPVPPAANTLPFAVEAGEQTPSMAFSGDAPVRP